MDSTPESAQATRQENTSTQELTLKVDFSWGKFKFLVTDQSDPKSTPIYIIDYSVTKPQLVFRPGSATATPFATGTINSVSINANCKIHGRPVKLKALKRWKTEYTHLSTAYSKNKDGSPVAMTWTSSSGFKNWDFVCQDENKMPVAQFSANPWAFKKVANITYMGSSIANGGTVSDAMRDEIAVTGLTLYICMAVRINSPLSLVGAIIARPGPIDNEDSKKDASTAAAAEGKNEEEEQRPKSSSKRKTT
ncbi:hypothetical protein FQN50_002405 [Emmonsiellopsis sp. PD_5]|nr:hypothetical protein FQN50_002405 [Emmonsiellopsis sp. PD_5]